MHSNKLRLIFGVGINDAGYKTTVTSLGKTTKCKFYFTWKNMLRRCYCVKTQKCRPTYIGCQVCDEWKVFSNFKAWMEQQDWEGKELDKDLLFSGNKTYSPETCVFVSSAVNNFILDNGRCRGNWPIGVSFNKEKRKFEARCSNPFTKKFENLGYFSCPQDAHKAWALRKRQLAVILADMQSEEKISTALKNRY